MNIRFVRFALITVIIGKLSAAELVVPNGTKLSARLEQTLSSSTAEAGQQVQMTLNDAVKVNGITVIPQGAPVVGSVILAEERKNMGRKGKLDFSVDKVRAADGEWIPLRYTMQKREGEGKGVSTGIMTAGAAILFWPAAPFFLLRKGKDVTINKGIVFEVFTDSDHAMTPQYVASLGGAQPGGAQPGVYQTAPAPLTPQGNQLMLAGQQSSAPATSAVAELATVNITSDIAGAEVEVDKVFIGSTPTQAKIAPGMHKITVKYGASIWSRDMMVQPNGTANVNAILKTAK
ncbi:MAG: PEGA domain-containing protein [Bryobacteraceae bacterium]|nr:PEGA domain-containing protein [Bryobacteraceae bacterium]